MAALQPMAMSQTKDDLLKTLNIGQETYTMMAKETDHVYKWLTSDKRHLKKNCKRKPPYDWSDIVEKSKDEAMARIAQSGDPHTSYYWNLAARTDDCPNWIARWFLYHKFRYRDGRNRNPIRGDDRKHIISPKHSHHYHHTHAEGVEDSKGYFGNQEPYSTADYLTDGQDPQRYSYSGTGSPSMLNGYTTNGYTDPSQTYQNGTSMGIYKQENQGDGQAAKGYWDPVRDV